MVEPVRRTSQAWLHPSPDGVPSARHDGASNELAATGVEPARAWSSPGADRHRVRDPTRPASRRPPATTRHHNRREILGPDGHVGARRGHRRPPDQSVTPNPVIFIHKLMVALSWANREKGATLHDAGKVGVLCLVACLVLWLDPMPWQRLASATRDRREPCPGAGSSARAGRPMTTVRCRAAIRWKDIVVRVPNSARVPWIDPWQASAALGLVGIPVLIAGAQVVARVVLGSEPLGSIFGPFTLVGGVADAVITVLALRRCPPSMRGTWQWVVAAAFAALLTNVGNAVAALMPVPSQDAHLTALLARGAFEVAVIGAVLALPGPTRTGRDRVVLSLDTLMIGGATFLVLWYLALGPALGAGRVTVPGVAMVVIGALDGGLLGAMTYVALQRPGGQAGRVLIGLTLAVICFVAPDLFLAQQSFGGVAVAVQNDVIWVVLLQSWFLGWAAWPTSRSRSSGINEGHQTARVLRTPSAGTLGDTVTPYVAVLIGYAFVGVAALRSALYPWRGLAVGTIVMTFGVVGRQVLALEENRRESIRDHVTQVANRVGLMQGLERAQARSARLGRPIAVMLFDLDGFKGINDTYGHDAGDQALTAFADVLRACVLGSDLVGRLGGDEFVVVLAGIRQQQDAVAVAERILEELRTPRRIGPVDLVLRASIGIALLRGDEPPADGLARADTAMYEAKRSRGSCWAVAAAAKECVRSD
jgi:diguanylate cyclase (GGDEF)-like protein